VIVVLLLLALGAYVLWMLLMLCLSFPASVAEDDGAWRALKRGIDLSRGTRGRILVLYILGMALRWGLGFLLTIPVVLIVVRIPGLDTPQHARLIQTILLMAVYGGSFAVRTFIKPMFAIAQLLFYYDQRIRREGFDIEWMMLQAGLVEAPAVAPEAAPWMPPVAGRNLEPGSPATLSIHPAIETAAEQSRPAESPVGIRPEIGLQPGEPT